MEQRHPLPPFTEETAREKIQMAEDAWNSKDPVRVSKAYTENSEWRNRNQFINGRQEIIQFLTGKWEKELNYKSEYASDRLDIEFINMESNIILFLIENNAIEYENKFSKQKNYKYRTIIYKNKEKKKRKETY